MKTIFFYYDFISPYAYLAWAQMPVIQKAVDCKIVYKPVLFAGLLNHHGQKGPAEIIAKRDYTLRDAYRLAQHFKIPMIGPPAHPFSPLIPLRLCMAMEDEQSLQKITGLLFKASWGDGQDITNPMVLGQLVLAAKVSPDGLMEKVQSQKVKDALKQNGDEAIALGIFGVPTFVVDREIFWGHDRMPLLLEFLQGKIVFDEALIARALARPRAADRKEIKMGESSK